MIADIQPPDLETKIAILRKKAEQQNITLPDNVALYIASKIRSNIRELEGALIRLIAYCSLTGSQISLSVANETLRDLFGPGEKPISVEMIQKTISDYYGLRVQDLKSKNKSANITLPRQIAMYLARHLTAASLPRIGLEFGGKHHTTVLHSVKKIQELRQKDKEINKLVQSFMDSY